MSCAPFAFAQDATEEAVRTEGQESVTDVTDSKPAQGEKVLHTIPEDSMVLQNSKGPDNKLIRDLVAARPGEDIVICVAGCFSARDRIVYAQPAEIKPVALMSSEPAESPKAETMSTAPAKSMKTSQAPIAPSSDPKAPAILNAKAKNTIGAGTQASATTSQPSSAATN